ncbi:PUR family DNA/RNA-binding protein [Brucepastera parasyntrophica]|uniref:PUR family DNA/RNA-binding protein n=1 Tax=Brucepastera parasyntrophica TaxID=2880008 RepID=UPI002108CDB0|nr:PUR family DNA/RNA-binding protein [Brucepastera parasyntrophica]ULQ59431.1 PUR family DNA/RNA-binding protein [Brucepastera parasyntrophica]
MGIRGELFTTTITLNNRTYFFNVKENRTGDVFLQVVESKNKEGTGFERQSIVVFEEDMQKFLSGLDSSLQFIEKSRREKLKKNAEKKNEQEKREPPEAQPAPLPKNENRLNRKPPQSGCV